MGNKEFKRKGRKGAKTPKDKSRIIFLKTGLTEEEALKHEVYMISVLGRKDLGTGILRNLTDGGDGVSGLVMSEEAKEKFRKNDNARAAAKLRLQKAVELTDMADGSVYIFDSVKDAARALKIKGNNLSTVCLGGRHSAGGFLARYWDPNLKDWGKGLFHLVREVREKQSQSIEGAHSKNKKAVELTNISNGEVLVYVSMRDAAKDLGLHATSIGAVCRGKLKSTGGFTARYLSEEFTH